jgi:bacillithiol biosynthesis deacetylase BshB1
MKLDILAFAAHPDDAEMSCGGTLYAHIQLGKKAGIVDLTRGELGTRGTPEIRAQESAEATRILGLHARENLGFADGFFENDKAHKLRVVQAIRRYQPEIILLNAVSDRHPDHGRGSTLVSESCFLAGLKMVETIGDDGEKQAAWRPKQVFHYIQDRSHKPDFVMDISAQWEKKMESVRAFRSQFFDPTNPEPNTYISSPEFMKFLEARSREWGHFIGVEFGEGFTVERQTGIRNLFDLI